MSDLSEKALIDALKSIDANNKVLCRPTKMFIPGPVREHLARQGYDTQEKVVAYVNKLLGRINYGKIEVENASS